MDILYYDSTECIVQYYRLNWFQYSFLVWGIRTMDCSAMFMLLYFGSTIGWKLNQSTKKDNEYVLPLWFIHNIMHGETYVELQLESRVEENIKKISVTENQWFNKIKISVNFQADLKLAFWLVRVLINSPLIL